jgi:hypothetical protein
MTWLALCSYPHLGEELHTLVGGELLHLYVAAQCKFESNI